MDANKKYNAELILAMVQTPGWALFEAHIQTRIRVLERDIQETPFVTMDESLVIKGLIGEVRALKRLLSYIENRQKDVQGG